jgi:hypothetical protein
MPSLPGQKRGTMPTPGTLETSSGQAQAPTPHVDRRKRLSHTWTGESACPTFVSGA